MWTGITGGSSSGSGLPRRPGGRVWAAPRSGWSPLAARARGVRPRSGADGGRQRADAARRGGGRVHLRGGPAWLPARTRAAGGCRRAVAGARGSGRLRAMPSSQIQLPPGVRSPFEVYVNGVRQELGADYTVSAGSSCSSVSWCSRSSAPGMVPRVLGDRDLQAQRRGRHSLRGGRPADGRPGHRQSRSTSAGRPGLKAKFSLGLSTVVLRTTSRRTHGRSSLSADRIARVAGERLSV